MAAHCYGNRRSLWSQLIRCSKQGLKGASSRLSGESTQSLSSQEGNLVIVRIAIASLSDQVDRTTRDRRLMDCEFAAFFLV